LFSPAYYFTVGTIGNAVKCYIISAVLWLYYLQTRLFISTYQTQKRTGNDNASRYTGTALKKRWSFSARDGVACEYRVL